MRRRENNDGRNIIDGVDGTFVAAGVCLALTVILWFAFRIPNVIGDLSGRNAMKIN